MPPRNSRLTTGLSRLKIIGFSLCLIAVVIVGRLFYIQIILHGKYAKIAQSEHNKKFTVPAKRGEILARDGEEIVPLVLNEPAYTIFADPRYVTDPQQLAKRLHVILKLPTAQLLKQLQSPGAYVVLQHQADKKTAAKIKKAQLKGIGVSETTRRVYPENRLAAQLLGFVNSDGKGQYGVEQALDRTIAGKAGQLNGATDVRGIPIATEGSVVTSPVDGSNVVLTIDRSIQTQAEFFLRKGVQKTNAASGSVMVMDPRNGQIKALANYPTFEPRNYAKTANISVFQNRVVTDAYEPGSVVKVFTMSTALDKGAVTPNTTYLDYSKRKIDGYTIRNTGPEVVKRRSMTEVITRSANTGTIFALERLGGGSLNAKGKQALYGYFTDRFRFGQTTGIEQTGESRGFVLPPKGAPDVNYANMSFGQGVSMTMVQLAAALSSIANDGTYYKPTIIDQIQKADGHIVQKQPTVVAENILKPKTIKQIKAMMETVVEQGTGRPAYRPGYRIAAKTGTAQVAKPSGGYYEDREIGSFFDFAPLDDAQYVIIVRVDNPRLGADAVASAAAAPIFADMSNWLIDYYGIPPRK